MAQEPILVAQELTLVAQESILLPQESILVPQESIPGLVWSGPVVDTRPVVEVRSGPVIDFSGPVRSGRSDC